MKCVASFLSKPGKISELSIIKTGTGAQFSGYRAEISGDAQSRWDAVDTGLAEL
jgi:hypothetical protein